MTWCKRFGVVGNVGGIAEKSSKKVIQIKTITIKLAEEQGFEPWVESPPQRFSRPSRSAAPALLRPTSLIPIFYWFFKKIKLLPGDPLCKK